MSVHHLVSETDRQQASPLHRQSGMQTEWQMTEFQITWGRHQNGILDQHVRLQPKIYAQNACGVRSNAAIGQTIYDIWLDGEHGAVWTIPFALLASCGRMPSWPSEFQHLLAARHKSFGHSHMSEHTC